MRVSRSRKGGSLLGGPEGKGTIGCLVSLVLLGATAFVAFKVAPTYFAYKSFETDAKTEISRAGAHYFDDETLTKNLLDLARKNEIRLKREEIKIERFAGQVHINIRYAVPLDLIVYARMMDFEINASSFIGRL
jgi:hypothetical protein